MRGEQLNVQAAAFNISESATRAAASFMMDNVVCAPKENYLDWQQRAVCSQTDPEVFFPEKGRSLDVRQAKKICAGCEVRLECLEDALATNQDTGVWGGLSVLERRKLKRQRQG